MAKLVRLRHINLTTFRWMGSIVAVYRNQVPSEGERGRVETSVRGIHRKTRRGKRSRRGGVMRAHCAAPEPFNPPPPDIFVSRRTKLDNRFYKYVLRDTGRLHKRLVLQKKLGNSINRRQIDFKLTDKWKAFAASQDSIERFRTKIASTIAVRNGYDLSYARLIVRMFLDVHYGRNIVSWLNLGDAVGEYGDLDEDLRAGYVAEANRALADPLGLWETTSDSGAPAAIKNTPTRRPSKSNAVRRPKPSGAGKKYRKRTSSPPKRWVRPPNAPFW